MAQRKKSKQHVLTDAAPMPSKVDLRMPKPQFDAVVRFIKTVAISRVIQLGLMMTATLSKLGKRSNAAKAVRGIPDASDQVNIGSVGTWLGSVRAGRKNHGNGAVSQVIVLDATVTARLEV